MLVFACAFLYAAAVTATRPPTGVHMVQAFWNSMDSNANGARLTLQQAREACHVHEFTYVRFSASAYWPRHQRMWINNSALYWRLMDDTMNALVTANCSHFIPSLFFNPFLYPDMAGEPMGVMVQGARGLATSQAWTWSVQYIDQFVSRYWNRSQIVCWELGNEWNLHFDLNQSSLCPMCGGSFWGSVSVRTQADNISTSDWIVMSESWANQIRALDPLRKPVGSGHSSPRESAENLRASYFARGRNWSLDTSGQFNKNIADTNSCCEWISIHMYPGDGATRWNITNPESADFALYAQAATELAGRNSSRPKRLYVGEYGQSHPAVVVGNTTTYRFNSTRPFISNLLDVMVRTAPGVSAAEVPAPGVAGITVLHAIWVWMFPSQNTTWAIWPGETTGIIQSLQAYERGRPTPSRTPSATAS